MRKAHFRYSFIFSPYFLLLNQVETRKRKKFKFPHKSCYCCWYHKKGRQDLLAGLAKEWWVWIVERESNFTPSISVIFQLCSLSSTQLTPVFTQKGAARCAMSMNERVERVCQVGQKSEGEIFSHLKKAVKWRTRPWFSKIFFSLFGISWISYTFFSRFRLPLCAKSEVQQLVRKLLVSKDISTVKIKL